MPKVSKTEEWTTRLFLVAIGVYIIVVGPTALTNWVVGLPLSLGPLLESKKFRLVLKISINKVSSKEVFQIQEVRDSTVFQGGIHYHEAPTQRERRRTYEPEVKEPVWEVDETFELQYGECQELPVELRNGNRLVGSAESNGKISVFLMGANSLRSFKDNLGFNYYWGREDVARTKVSYEASETRTHYIVVSNGYEDDEGEDEDEPVSVEVKLRIEN